MRRKMQAFLWSVVMAFCLTCGSRAHATTILYFEDETEGTSAVPGALELLGLSDSTTTVQTIEDFVSQLQGEGAAWDIVILGEQAGTVFTEALGGAVGAYVAGGGRVLGTTWLPGSGFAELMQASPVETNAPTITTDANPVFAGLGRAISFIDPGWGVWTRSWSPLESAIGVGTLGKGSAIIIGNGGRTILFGPLFDTFADLAIGNRLIANLIRALCVPTTCAADGVGCGEIADGCGGTLTCGCPDDGNPCTETACSDGRCEYPAGHAGALCRPAAGLCDVAEACAGPSTMCPADSLAPAGTECRASAGGCDPAETCTGADWACPSDALAPTGTVCRAAAGACDLDETCGGASVACPEDNTRRDGDLCDDDDPGTATASCEAQECRGVALGMSIPGDLAVPANRPPGKVKIPVEIAIPDVPGSSAAWVKMQGFVDCDELPANGRPAECGSGAAQAQLYLPRVTSVFLAVTKPKRKGLGSARARVLRANLPLNKTGKKLFARLKTGEQQRQLPVQVTAQMQDRQGRTISAVFRSLLERRR